MTRPQVTISLGNSCSHGYERKFISQHRSSTRHAWYTLLLFMWTLALLLPFYRWGNWGSKFRQNLAKKEKVNVLLSHVQLFGTPWTVACQAPLSMGFSGQDYWSGLPSPSPGDLPDPGNAPGSLALQANSLPSDPSGKPKSSINGQHLSSTPV